MAELTEAIYRQDHDLLPQYVSFMQAGEPVPYNPASHVTLSARFLPEADGVTFRLKAVYTDSLRSSLTKEHAVSIPRISRICGPVRQTDDTTFVLNFYRMGMNNKSGQQASPLWQAPMATGNIKNVCRNLASLSLIP